MNLEGELQQALSNAIHLSDAMAELVVEIPQPAKEEMRRAYLAMEDVVGDLQMVLQRIASQPRGPASSDEALGGM
jgi:hypothetical protein